MPRMSRLPLIIVLAILIPQLAGPVEASDHENNCNGALRQYAGDEPTQEELTAILKKHERWLNKPAPRDNDDPDRAYLCGANLQGGLPWKVNLQGADLTNADLRGVHVSPDLSHADLEYAHLEEANLAGAHLAGAHLAGADLSGAEVKGADFDLLPDSLPDPLGLSSAEGLQFVQFTYQQAGLVKLRKEFKDLGLRNQENQLTYAIKRSDLRRDSHGPVEQWVNYVFFELTCQYGMSPERPLIIVAFLSILFSVIYAFAQIFPGQRGGIWVVWEENRIDKTEGGDAPQRLTAGFPSARSQGRLRVLSIPLLAAYFSLLSALRIGWSGLNLGTWISRMQSREYELHATGWVRVVSGLQSLISVYLVALTILTYFGTPFEY